MRARTSKRTAMLAVLTTLTMIIAGMTGAHAADTPGVLLQAGNGHAQSKPVTGFESFRVVTILHDANRFPVGETQNTAAGAAAYLAWGTILNGGNEQIAASVGTDDGLRWGAPSPATITGQGGHASPLTIAPGTSFAVTYTDFDNAPTFDLFYVPLGANKFNIASDNQAPDCESAIPPTANCQQTPIHFAQSTDGVSWSQDMTIDQDPDHQLITGTGTGPMQGTNGPTQVIWNRAANQTSCQPPSAASYPQNCQFIMIYRAIGDSGNESLAIAGSDGNGANAQFFATGASPVILSPSGWHSGSLTGQLLQTAINTQGSEYQLYYSGTNSAGTSGIGLATSDDGVAFTDASAAAPITPSSLFDSVFHNAGVLRDPIAINDGGLHDKVLFDRQVGSTDSEFLAATGTDPGSSLRLNVQSPFGVYQTLASATVDLFVNDTASTPLFDNGHSSITIDGVAARSVSIQPSLILATTKPGFEITASAPDQHLADGPHSLSVSIQDSASNVATASAPFTLDSTPTTTTITGSPQGNITAGAQLAFPGSLGTFTGQTSDAGNSSWNKIVKMRAVVTNPLNQVREYVSSNARGWSFSQDLPANSTTWRWVVPTTTPTDWFDQNGLNQSKIDPFYAFPGNYTVTIGGVDLAGNIEASSVANTAVVQVV